MTEKELQQYLLTHYPKENEKWEWKEYKSLKNSVSGREGDDMISYISAIANMQGGVLIVGVRDKTLDIIGIQDLADYSIENIKFRIVKNCVNLNVDAFEIEEIITIDSKKRIWVVKIPKHQYRLPVYAHKKAWQRINDNLVEITKPRLEAILSEVKTNRKTIDRLIIPKLSVVLTAEQKRNKVKNFLTALKSDGKLQISR